MLILVLAIVVTLGWLFVRRMRLSDEVLRRVGIGCVTAFVGGALALRAGPAAVGLLVAAAAVALWLRGRGRDEGGPGDDGPEPPVGPEPIDGEEFDRARAAWERGSVKRG
jgi:hypothetical protein